MSPTPEDKAREVIDSMLDKAGWRVCDFKDANIRAAAGVVIRNYPLKKGYGFADYLFYIDGKAAGILSRYGTVGEVRLVKVNMPFQASYSIAILKPITEEIGEYLSIIFQTEPIQKQIKKYTRATAQPDLGLAHIRQLHLPVIPDEEQKKIVEEINRQFSVVGEIETTAETNLKRVEHLRKAILKKAFEGKLL